MTGVQQQESAVPPSDLEIALTNETMRRAQHRPRFRDPLELLPKGLTKLYSIWVGMTYPFASKGRNLSFHLRVSWTDKGQSESALVVQ
jgi:hypothetical protein